MGDPEGDEGCPDTSGSVTCENAIVPASALQCIAGLPGAARRTELMRAVPVLWYGNAGLTLTKVKSLILRYCIAALFGLLLASAPLYAAPVSDLFQARVDAAGRDAAARDEALRQALQQVLVRVTGSRRLVGEASARPLLQEPGRFVEQYRFEDVADAGGGEQLRLWAQFDGVALEREIDTETLDSGDKASATRSDLREGGGHLHLLDL